MCPPGRVQTGYPLGQFCEEPSGPIERQRAFGPEQGAKGAVGAG
jgi:hypothetical protein